MIDGYGCTSYWTSTFGVYPDSKPGNLSIDLGAVFAIKKIDVYRLYSSITTYGVTDSIIYIGNSSDTTGNIIFADTPTKEISTISSFEPKNYVAGRYLEITLKTETYTFITELRIIVH